LKKKTEALRSSVKLCQVGIEPVQGVHRGRTSVEKFRKKKTESLRVL
jgi:hypothetical protein